MAKRHLSQAFVIFGIVCLGTLPLRFSSGFARILFLQRVRPRMSYIYYLLITIGSTDAILSIVNAGASVSAVDKDGLIVADRGEVLQLFAQHICNEIKAGSVDKHQA